MKRFFTIIALSVFLVCGLASCDTTTGEDQVVYSDAAYLSTLRLGTLKRTMHTTSPSGGDSTYTASVSLANMPMVIDHNGGRIYNARPLPVGTDLSAVNFSAIGASGLVAIKSIVSGIDTAFTTADTFDVRQPREVFVISTSGKTRHTYTLSLTVAQEAQDSLLWTAVPTGTSFNGLDAPRLVAVGDTLHLFGLRGSVAQHYTSTDGALWHTATATGLSPTALPAIVGQGATLWTVEAGLLSRSVDGGRTWERVNTSFEPQSLLGVSSAKVYVQATDHKVYALTTGDAELVAVTEAEGLPTAQNNSVLLPVAGGMAQQLVAVGRNADGQVVAYTKYENLPGNTSAFYPLKNDGSKAKALPLWGSLHVASSGRTLLAVGLAQGMPQMYYSHDAGLTWQEGATYRLPQDHVATSGVAFTSDAKGRLWLISTTLSQVWYADRGQ